MKNDRFLPYAVILGVVAIVAIVTLFMGESGVEGNVVRKEYVGGNQFPCVDSDPANDVEVAGHLDRGNYRYHDYCLDDNTLNQYHCPVGSNLEVSSYECPNGCQFGACI